MLRLHRLLRAGLTVVFILFLIDSPSPDASAQKHSRPPKPHVPRAGRAHYSVVQARDPHWRAVTIAANPEIAHIMKVRMQRRGYQVRLHYESAGRVLVSARMMHWHAVSVFNSPQVANHAVALLRARGMQARIHRVV
jgi:hypothetical protein